MHKLMVSRVVLAGRGWMDDSWCQNLVPSHGLVCLSQCFFLVDSLSQLANQDCRRLPTRYNGDLFLASLNRGLEMVRAQNSMPDNFRRKRTAVILRFDIFGTYICLDSCGLYHHIHGFIPAIYFGAR